MSGQPGRLRVPIKSKLPGNPKLTQRNIGTRCTAERNRGNPGQWIIWFGREYATVDAINLHDTVVFDKPTVY